MVAIGNILGGVAQGLGQGAGIGMQFQAMRQRAQAQQVALRRQQQAQFREGVDTLAKLNLVPKPFREQVVNEVNQTAFGGALDPETIKNYARMGDQDFQTIGELVQDAFPGATPEQFAASVRQFGGIAPAFRALATVAERKAARQTAAQQRADLATLGEQAFMAQAQPRGVIAASEPTRTETLTLPVPTGPIRQARIAQLQEGLRFFNTPQGQRVLQSDEGQAAFQAVRTELQALTQQAQRATGEARAGRQEQRTISREKRQAARDLRKEFTQVSNTFRQVAANYGRIQAAVQDPSPAGDIAVVYGFMKMLDPGSTVMIGEQAQVTNAGNVPERIRNTYNRLLSGELFGGPDSEIRRDFADRARLLFETAQQDQALVRRQFEEIARRAGIDPRDVLLRFRQQQQPQQRRGSTQEATPAGQLAPETQRRINDRFNK